MNRTYIQRQPDNFHFHARQGEMSEMLVANFSPFRRMRTMPNTTPPITDLVQMQCYDEDIRAACRKAEVEVDILPSLYLTPETTPGEINLCWQVYGRWMSVKRYPRGSNTTTNAHQGIYSLRDVDASIYSKMSQLKIPFNIHGEVPEILDVALFDQGTGLDLTQVTFSEEAFLDELCWLAGSYPDLRIILEHVSSARAIECVRGLGPNLAATITAHHMYLDFEAVRGHPHHKCMPLAKRESDRVAIVEAATSGDTKFFYGGDEAAHRKRLKEADVPFGECPSGVWYPGSVAIALLAQVFDDASALERLEAFSANNGAIFHGFGLNDSKISLIDEPWEVPESYGSEEDDTVVVPFMAGKTLKWQLMGVA